MRFWRLVSPVLLVIMLASQFANVVAMQTPPQAPQDVATTEITTTSDGQVAPALTSTEPGSATLTMTSSASTAEAGNAPAQDDFIPAILNWSTTDSGGWYTAIPEIVDDSEWPYVDIRITNPNKYWLTFAVTDSTSTSIVERSSVPARVGVINPGGHATFKVLYDEFADASITFRVEGDLNPLPGTLGLGGGFYTILDYALRLFTKDVARLSDVPNLVDYVSTVWSLFSASTVCTDAYRLLEEESSGGSKFLRTAEIADGLISCFTQGPVAAILINMSIAVFGLAWDAKEAGIRLGWVTTLADFLVGFLQAGLGGMRSDITFESLRIAFNKLILYQENDLGQAVLGGCYAIYRHDRVASSRCDGDDGEEDGTFTFVTFASDAPASLRPVISPLGYLPLPEQPLQLVRDEAIYKTVELEDATGFMVNVVDENNVPVPGACFSLTRIAGQGSGTSGPAFMEQCDFSDNPDGESDGHTMFDTLLEGDYTLSQTRVPFNYNGAEDRTVKLVPDDFNSATVVNSYIDDGSLVINLSGEDGSLPLGACFDIFRRYPEPRQFVARLCDETNGVLRLDVIEYGEYELVQVTTPNGYVRAEDRTFVIFGGRETVLHVQNRMPGTLNIRSVDENGTAYGGSCFRITEIDTYIESDEQCDSNGDGTVTFANLRSGSYSIRQTVNPSTTHREATDLTVTVAPITPTNVDMVLRNYAVLNVYTVNAAGEPISRACFSMMVKIDGTWEPRFVQICDDDNDGHIAFTHLDVGDYWLYANFNPNLYLPAEDQYITIADDDDVVDHEIVYQPAGAIVITTKNGQTGQVIGANYSLYRNEGGVPGTEEVARGYHGPVNGQQQSRIDHLQPGDYFLKQTSLPGKLLVVQEYIPVTVTLGNAQPVTVTNMHPFPTVLIHTRNEAGTLLPGACYAFDGRTSCDDSDGQLDGITRFALVTPGARRLIQSTPPTGQERHPDITVTVPAEPGPHDVYVDYQQPGASARILITTLDDETGAELGLCYNVYRLESGSERHVALLCPRYVNGQLVTVFESPTGGSFVVEQASPESTPVLPNTERISVTVAVGEERALTFRNQPWPSLLIAAVDQNGSPVIGACYYLRPEGPPGTMYFNGCDADDGFDDGVAVFARIRPAEYRILGTPPDGQGFGNPHHYYRVEAIPGVLDTTVTFSVGGSIQFHVEDAETSAPLPYYCVQIFRIGLYGDEIHEGSGCSSASGDAFVIENLEPGRYVYRGSPGSHPGYFVDRNPVPFTITSGQQVRDRIKVTPHPTLTITSRGANNQPVPGACYALERIGDYGSATYCDSDDGSLDGVMTLPRMQPGSYWWRQTTPPFGYALAGNGELVIPAVPGKVSLTIDHLVGGSVQLQGKSGSQWDHRWFRVYKDPGNGDLGPEVARPDYFNNYTAHGLTPGNYILRQVAPTTEEIVAPDIAFTVVAGQNQAIWIGVTPAEEAVTFGISGPPVVRDAESHSIYLTARNGDGSPANLDGYSFAFDCGYGGFGDPSPATQIDCPFTGVGKKVLKARVIRPDRSTIELTLTVTVIAGRPTENPILTLSATEIEAGNVVTVTGLRFGPNEEVRIYWESDEREPVATVTTREDGSFAREITINDGTLTGSHEVIAVGQTSTVRSSTWLTVVDTPMPTPTPTETPAPAPEVTLNPTTSAPGTVVKVSGTGFGPQEQVRIYWGTANATLLGYLSTSNEGAFTGYVTVPKSAMDGQYSIVVVGQDSSASGSTTLMVEAPAASVTISPANPTPGAVVKVLGTGFAPNQQVDIYWGSANGVLMGYRPTDNQGGFTGYITIPATASAGSHLIVAKVKDGNVLAEATITVDAPAVSLTISPASPKPGTAVKVTGAGFAPNKRVNIHWGTANGTLIGYRTTDSTGAFVGYVTVPATAAGGSHTIVAVGGNGEPTHSAQITVDAPAVSASMSPTNPKPGTVVTVTGAGFTPGEDVEIRWSTSTGTLLGWKKADSTGGIRGAVTIPASAGGSHTIVLRGKSSTITAPVTFTVASSTIPASIAVSQTAVQPGAVVTVRGAGMAPGQPVEIRWNSQGGPLLGRVTAKQDGTYSGAITIPRSATSGANQLYAVSSAQSASVQVNVSATAMSTITASQTATPTPSPTPDASATPTATPDVAGTPEPTEAPTEEPVVPTGKLVVELRDANGVLVAGACYELWDASGTRVGTFCDGANTTPIDGVIDIEDLPVGSYLVREKATLAGYNPVPERWVEVREGETTVRLATSAIPTPTPEPTPIPTETPIETPIAAPVETPTSAPEPANQDDPAQEPPADTEVPAA